MNDLALTLQVEPNAGNHLAWMSAVLGLQRTLMAAERTAVALIAFGFTVVQVFQNLQTVVPPRMLILGPHLPRDVGLIMIMAGVGSLALFTWQYLRAVAYLGDDAFAAIAIRLSIPLHQLTCFTAYAIMAIGGLAMVSVFLSF
jgi:inner membrane protein YidH